MSNIKPEAGHGMEKLVLVRSSNGSVRVLVVTTEDAERISADAAACDVFRRQTQAVEE